MPAEEEPPLPLVAEGAVDGPNLWVAIKIRMGDAPMMINIAIRNTTLPFAWGVLDYDEAGQNVGGLMFVFIPLLGGEAQAQTTHVPSTTASPQVNVLPGGAGLGIGEGAPAGETKVKTFLFYQTGPANVTWNLTGERVELLGVTSGRSAFLYRAPDFRSPLQVAATAPVGSVRVTKEATFRLDADAPFIGHYSGSNGDTLAMDTPRGRVACDPSCVWGEVQGPNANPPGEYVFHADGTSYDLLATELAIAGVLGPRLPE